MPTLGLAPRNWSFLAMWSWPFPCVGSRAATIRLNCRMIPVGVVREGVTAQYDIRFDVDVEFLRRLDRGEMSALTAMGQARSSDPIPLSPRFGPDFGKIADAPLLFRRLCFHFWTRGWPEIIPFSEAAARSVHGGNAAVFVYDREFRSAWYQLKPGMHINAIRRTRRTTFRNWSS